MLFKPMHRDATYWYVYISALIEQHFHGITKYIGLSPFLRWQVRIDQCCVYCSNLEKLNSFWASSAMNLEPYHVSGYLVVFQRFYGSLWHSIFFSRWPSFQAMFCLTLLRHCSEDSCCQHRCHCDQGVSQVVSAGKQP